MNNKISIIITCYNDEKYIEQAVTMALAQAYEPKEVIVVDDGSNSRTKEVIKNLENKMDLLITQENQGVSAARNRGIKEATGKYILVWDSDDYFNPDFCRKAIPIFTKNPSAVLVTCYTRWFSSRKKFDKIFKPRGGSLKDALFGNVAMGSVMFEKSSWERAGGYDENMTLGYEDWEFYLRLLKRGGETMVLPEVLFNYRNKPNSKNKTANKRKYELLIYIYLKHQDLYKANFELFVRHMLELNMQKELKNEKLCQGLDYKIGKLVIKPLRLLRIVK